MNCIRCRVDVKETVHIFWGGEERRRELEKGLDRPVSLCKNPVLKIQKPVLCSCGRYYFDFDIPCPICGITYAELEKSNEQ